MSLRIRFTLLYSLLAGGILLIFGSAVYVLVGVLLVNQIDDTLTQTTHDIVSNTQINSVGELNVIILPQFNFTSNLFIQVWEVNGSLHSSSQNIGGYNEPLDAEGLKSSLPVFRNVIIQEAHLRTLSVPLQVGGRPIGTFQPRVRTRAP